MKAVIALVLALASLTAHAQDTREWARTDTAMQAAVTAALLIDWHQTRQAMGEPSRYHEMNPMIGHIPRAVNQYFAASIVGSAALAYVLPQPWRQRFQAGELGLEIVVIGHNKSLGLRVAF